MPSQATSHLKATIGANIDRGIASRKMTNRAVGEAVGATEHQVWRWRKGRHTPTLDTLVSLADLLFEGDVNELYAEPEEEAA